MHEHLNELNSNQKSAVVQKDGPVLIIAGAGAGKTKTITHRILHLINEGVAPSSILAVTFTNKASKEMKERVEKMLSSDGKINFPISNQEKPFISTFHSLGVYIIKENSHKLGLTRHFNIFDKNDSKRAVKEALIQNGLDPKQFDPAKIVGFISKQKGNSISYEKFKENTGNDYFSQIVSKVWDGYEKTLKKEKALDFDDLLLKTSILLREDSGVRNYYQNKWQYVHIDEYQDTNRVQYEISKLLVGKKQNICVVGDTDQCLLPSTKILTKFGEKRIDKIKKGEKIISASGYGETCFSKVLKIKKRNYKKEIIKIKTKRGFVLETTPEHIVFSDFSLENNIFYIYLMYKKGIGFRIGKVQGKRSPKKDVDQIGFIVRNNQEKSDKMWVLKVCKNKQEASFWENFYAFKYGIPLIVFFDNGRKISMDQILINKLFKDIDTEKRAFKILDDLGLSFNYPHYLPQGTTKINSDKKRVNLRLTMFDDKRKSLTSPWGASRISINTTDTIFKKILEKNDFKTRKGKNNDWRFEMSVLSYSKAEKIVEKILSLDKDISLKRSAFVTKNKRLSFLPTGSLHPTMKIPFYEKGKIEEDIIISIEKNFYSGFVYDLDIENTHNYIANGLVVHNCIYGWRGANHKNILNFEKDFSNVKTVVLEENYRSTKNILSAANDVIKKNKTRKEKNLFTNNAEGEKISLFSNYTERQEADNVVGKIQELLEKGADLNEVAVLYRANFQSRALEEAFLMAGVPYQVLGTKFFDRKEIKDIISFIKASLNPDSLTDIKRIINVPPRGIGEVTLLKIFNNKKEELNPKTREKVDNFYQMLEKIGESCLKDKPSDVIKFIMKITGIEAKLSPSDGSGTEEDKERLDNIKEMVTLAVKYDYFVVPEGLEKMLEDSALATDQDEIDNKNKKDAVKLMTVHASKGLEFDYVFITGLEDSLFPSKRNNNQTEDEKEEERRLFYVALTRARKKLFLSYASIRMIFGSKQMNPPSEFIFDIKDNLIEDESYKRTENYGNSEKIIYLDL